MAENGCSLEDCHTNLFALTDLAGIKWRRLNAQSDSSYFVDPLDDPVLISYSKCIQADILCVWRRQPQSSNTKNVDQIANPKELWLFWYGEEPSSLHNLISQDLYEVESGGWDNGLLSYECRTLLFKALHNLIERCLLSQNFIRVGKWFVQPTSNEPSPRKEKSPNLSLSFHFFLHGDSTVCASIDVRQHPPLYNLQSSHLSVASQIPHGVQVGNHLRNHFDSTLNQQRMIPKLIRDYTNANFIPVLLAPYGLSGYLTGRSYLESDHKTHQLLEEWRRFYCLSKSIDTDDGGSQLPAAVEVIVAGVRLRYPSSYVMVTGETEAELSKFRQFNSGPGSTPTDSTDTPHKHSSSASTSNTPTNCDANSPRLSFVGNKVMSSRVIEKTWQDCTIASGILNNGHHRQMKASDFHDDGLPAMTSVLWDFGDPVQKNTCACSRARLTKSKVPAGMISKQQPPPPPGAGKHGKGPDKFDRGRHQRSFAPYHKRSSSQALDGAVTGLDFVLSKNLGSIRSSHRGGGGSSTTRCSSGVGGPIGGVDSPHSAAPSPLMASQTQPSFSQNGDPTMPTLSPHPPPKTGERDVHSTGHSTVEELLDANVGCGAPQAGGGDNVSILSSVLFGFGDAKPQSDIKKPAVTCNNVKDEFVAMPIPVRVNHVKTETIPSWLDMQLKKCAKISSLKRPVLPTTFDGENEEEMTTNSFYDYPSDNLMDITNRRLHSDLESPGCISPLLHASNVGMLAGGGQPVTSSGSIFSRPRDRSPSSPHRPMDDPYVFSDETDPDLSNFKIREMHMSREDGISRHSPFASIRQDDSNRRDIDRACNGFEDFRSSSDLALSPTARPGQVTTTLTREHDLIASFQDLDKMFDTDEECNTDSPRSPGISDKPRDDPTTCPRFKTSSGGLPLGPTFLQGLTTKELARMYPTPPSADNPCSEPSPMQGVDYASDVMSHMDGLHFQLHAHQGTSCIVKEEAQLSGTAAAIRKEFPYVYTVPTSCKFPASADYDPIELPIVRTPAPDFVYKIPPHQPPMFGQTVNSHGSSVHPVDIAGCYPSSRAGPDSSMFLGPYSQQRTPRTPMSYEMMSPASNASSSYLNKNLSSIDNSQSTGSQSAEVSSLIVNIALADSILNIFKDRNFDSCTICVCNMNIDGNDIGLYLPERGSSEDQYRCNCAFSSIINRRYGLKSGLFYEDEVEITGIRHNHLDGRKPSLLVGRLNEPNRGQHQQGNTDASSLDGISPDLLILLQEQLTSLYPSCAVLRNYKSQSNCLEPKQIQEWSSFLDMRDGNNACMAALEFSRQMSMDSCNHTFVDRANMCLHKWPFFHNLAKIPSNSQDVVRLLKLLQPLLQDAIQKKRATRLWESVYTISGPLSWKDFHLLAGRGSEETSEPKSVPSLLVGYDKDWMTLSPYAIKYWDKLLLEPYSETKDILYLIVSPDNEHVLAKATTFFAELSGMYEQCRLGKHRPLSEKVRNGIVRIGTKNLNLTSGEPIDSWFQDIGTSPTAVKLRLYAQVCCKLLSALVRQELSEKRLICEKIAASDHSTGDYQRIQPRPHIDSTFSTPLSTSFSASQTVNNAPDVQQNNSSNFVNERAADSLDASQTKDPLGQDSDQDHTDTNTTTATDFSGAMPYVVLYMIDPFDYGNLEGTEASRLAMLGILRCFLEMLKLMPENLQSSIQLQVVPQQVLLDFTEHISSQYLKNLCFSVYTGCRRIINQKIPGHTLTGFGPASIAEKIVRSQNVGALTSTKVYTPSFIIAPSVSQPVTDSWTEMPEKSGVLLCAYCLSEDQRWLLGSVTNSCGELLETCCINIDVPNRSQRKKAVVRRTGLLKLWEFLIGVMSGTTTPWRVVIGRFGRLGHGELKGWATILSKKSLVSSSQHLRKICNTCNILPSSQSPAILSACLVSTELHPNIHIMIDSVKLEENRSSKSQLSTPRDASCTHILVFPTSATAQANLPVNQENHIDFTEPEFTEDDILKGFDTEGIAEDDIGDLFFSFGGSPGNSPKNHSAPGSPAAHDDHHMFGFRNLGKVRQGSKHIDQEEMNNHNLLQQPQAMGFYISTAQPGPLPQWFWSSCPQRQGCCPICFKASLHIHCPLVQQNQDDLIHQSIHMKHSHPLDSNLTCDVLRYVLETYNMLSWLTIDPTTNDRRSCLPAHMLILMQLYHGLNTYI